MLMQMFPAVLALVAIYAIFDRIGSSLSRPSA
jgi:ABC-type maltose transport system permease subunit